VTVPTYTRTLGEVDATSIGLVGGKGANLGELVAAGAPVPVAFCVTTDAYRAFLDHHDLPQRIKELLAEVDYGDPAGIERSASQIRSLIVASEIPADIAADVAAGYATLEAQLGAGVEVSVRSSATAEDLPGTSFAGQQDTYLCISGVEAVTDAVRRCWASLWTDRAIAYRHTQGFDHDAVLLAVVVQELFPSEVAGVLFTANPVTSNPFQLFLNASWGLGEAVVSGHVNPDQLIVDKATLAVVDRQLNDKQVMTVRAEGGQGSTLVAVPDADRQRSCLTDDQVTRLCTVAKEIEAHYGFYQDIEWGIAGDRVAILQAREITGADLDFGHELESWKTERARAEMYDEQWVWSRAYSDEFQTGPTTPSFYTYTQFGMSVLKMLTLVLTGTQNTLGYQPHELMDLPYYRWYGARAYFNLAFERDRIRFFTPPFARTEAMLLPFPEEERAELRDLPFDWDRFFGMLQVLEDTNPEVSLTGTTKVMYDGMARWVAAEEEFWAGYDYDAATVEDIVNEQMTLRGESKFFPNVVLPFTVYLYIMSPALEALCHAWFDDADGTIFTSLVGGIQSKTTEENVALWELSRSLASSPELVDLLRTTPDDQVLEALTAVEDGPAFRRAFDAFIEVYGHRGGAERDAYHRRWRDAPEHVVQALRLMVELDEDQSPAVHAQRLEARMRATKARCVEQLRGEPDDLGDFEWLARFHALTGAPRGSRADLFEWFVEHVQDWYFYRDFERFYNDKNMARNRYHLEAIGRKFLAAGLVLDVEDPFFLGKDEVLAAAAGELSAAQVQTRVRVRRKVYEKYARQEPPKYVRGWTPFDDDVVYAEGALVGIGASTGTVTGRARVCRDLSEIGNVQPGDILVTVATDPGWTTVFSIVSGVVVETGGVVAHAVMISREYGLPCVSNLARACESIPDGARITVNGSTGRVVVHDGEEA
jgi:pyruvate,water dikinase